MRSNAQMGHNILVHTSGYLAYGIVCFLIINLALLVG